MMSVALAASPFPANPPTVEDVDGDGQSYRELGALGALGGRYTMRHR